MLRKLTPTEEGQPVEFKLPDLTATDWQAYLILGTLVLLFALEAPAARREQRPRLYRQSYFANLGTWLINDTLLSLLSVSSLWWLAERFADRGLLGGVADPLWKAVLSFVLLDLVLYFWHRANHAFGWLWMFHKVHHSDRVMNVTTAFRLHFMEVLLTLLVKALFIMVAGVDAALVVANETIMTLFVMFHHSNLSLPGLRRLAGVVIVPHLHRVHHSEKREEHDRNFGLVFSWWDRLFGTLAQAEPATIGLRDVESKGLWALVKFGLTWDTVPAPPVLPSTPCLRAMIAEAAYYRAEQRGFTPGHEIPDWIEAEREILRRF